MVPLRHDEVSPRPKLVEVAERHLFHCRRGDVEVREAEDVGPGVVLFHGGDVVVGPELDLVLSYGGGGENALDLGSHEHELLRDWEHGRGLPGNVVDELFIVRLDDEEVGGRGVRVKS